MTELNAVLFDITSVIGRQQPSSTMTRHYPDVEAKVVEIYLFIFHGRSSTIKAGTYSHPSQCFDTVRALAHYFGITTQNPNLELKRRHPSLYDQITWYVNQLVGELRGYLLKHVPAPFYYFGETQPRPDFTMHIKKIRTKTYGVRKFIAYHRLQETLKWPQSL